MKNIVNPVLIQNPRNCFKIISVDPAIIEKIIMKYNFNPFFMVQNPRKCLEMEIMCLDICAPICGFDGKTYSHNCHLDVQNCLHITQGQSEVNKAYDGECGPLGPYQRIIIILVIVVGSVLGIIIVIFTSYKLWKIFGIKKESKELIESSTSEDSLPELFIRL